MLANYHTHTYRCKHANGDIDDYIECAIAQQLDTLGFSDHTPLPDNNWLGVRMHIDDLPAYSSKLDEVKVTQRGKLKILKGLECDWGEEYADFFRDTLLRDYKFDYLIGASHWYRYRGEWAQSFNIITGDEVIAYAEFYAEAIASKIFTFMAHPDVFCSKYDWDDRAAQAAKIILSAAEKYQVALEINGYGFRKPTIDLPSGRRIAYPYGKFWQMASDYDIKVICNSDAHRPQDVIAGIAETENMAKDYGLIHFIMPNFESATRCE